VRTEQLTEIGANLAVLLVTFIAVLFAIQPAGAQTANAQTLFTANCAACHGPKGDGDTVIGKQLQASDLRSPDIQKKTDAELKASITNGKDNKMPPFGTKLKPDEITGLIKYIRELAKAKK
jgi:mono/diheme cytochrome c family protein